MTAPAPPAVPGKDPVPHAPVTPAPAALRQHAATPATAEAPAQRWTATESPARMPAPSNLIAVASGKGGVGKTWLAITLAQALSAAGRSALLFDGDLGLANVDVQLGLNPRVDLGRALTGQMPLEQALEPVAATGFDVVAGRSGSGGLAALSAGQLAALGRDLAALAGRYDQVVMDLGAGIDATVRTLAGFAGMGLVVTTDEPTALTDAYAYIKVVRQHRPDADLRVAVNMAGSKREGERTYATLRKACESFLGMAPPLAGVIRRDPKVREAIRAQTPILTRHPNSPASADVTALAQAVLDPAR